jgi:hypothetical protein
MDNTRALSILEKKEITEDDKRFLKSHIETYDYLLNTFELEIMRLQSAVDFYTTMQSRITSLSENVLIVLEENYNKLTKLKKYLSEDEDLATCNFIRGQLKTAHDMLKGLRLDKLLELLFQERDDDQWKQNKTNPSS